MFLCLHSFYLLALTTWHCTASRLSLSGLKHSVWEAEARLRARIPKLSIHDGVAEEPALSRRLRTPQYKGYAKITRTNGVLGYFVVPISIGNQTVDVLLNTCSNILWVMSSGLGSDLMKQAPQHQYFIPGNSSSFNYMVGNWTATFASNAINVAGFRGNDTIKIGEVASAQPMGFGSVAAMTDSLWAADFSGNLGVSWLSSGSSSKGIATSFMNWVIDELAQPILSLDCDVQRGEDYSIAIGSMDVLRYEGSLTVIPIMDQTVDSWTVQVRSYWIGGQMLGADAYTDNMPLTFDTGATSCWVHGHIADDYWKQVPRAQNVESGWVWPCSDPTPDFTIQWEQAADWITIPGKVLNNGNRSMVLSYGNETWCYGGLQIAPSINAVMGIPFFEAIYTSFNYQNATVSIANYKNEAGNASKDAPGDVSGGSSPSSYVFSFSKTSAIGHISTGSANATDTNSNSAQPTGTGTGTQIRSGSGTAVSAPSSGPSASSGQPHSSGPSAPSGSSASSGQPASSAQAKSSNPPPSAT